LQSFYSLFSLQKKELIYFYNYYKTSDKINDNKTLISEEYFYIDVIIKSNVEINEMLNIDIQYFTLSKALSSIGGFASICLLGYGLITAFFLPKIFMLKLSLHMHKSKSKMG